MSIAGIEITTEAVIGVQVASTWAMVGLIWYVQLVHYPLFFYIDRERFSEFHIQHARRTTWIVAPVMSAELLSGVWLAVVGPPVWIAGLILIGVNWASTLFIQMPMHLRLERGFDTRTHQWLVWSNWLRTVVWTARGAFVLWAATV